MVKKLFPAQVFLHYQSLKTNFYENYRRKALMSHDFSSIVTRLLRLYDKRLM